MKQQYPAVRTIKCYESMRVQLKNSVNIKREMRIRLQRVAILLGRPGKTVKRRKLNSPSRMFRAGQ